MFINRTRKDSLNLFFKIHGKKVYVYKQNSKGQFKPIFQNLETKSVRL